MPQKVKFRPKYYKMSAFPAEIYGVITDFLVDIRPILLSCWEIYYHLYDRADAKFWRVSGIDRAKIALPKMYHLIKISIPDMVLSGNVGLVKNRVCISELRCHLSSVIASRSNEMFDLVWKNIGEFNFDSNYVLYTCYIHDNLYAMKNLEKFTCISEIIYRSAKYEAVNILRHFTPKCSTAGMVSALQTAVKHGKIEALKILHAAGADIHYVGLLRTAIYHNCEDIVDYLAKNGVRDDFIWGIVAKYS